MNKITQPVSYRAKWVMIDPETWISNGYISISQSGLIGDCGQISSHQASPIIDLGEGVLMPCLINAHTHLELSALKNRIPMHLGFANWVNQLISERIVMGPERLASEAQTACQYLWETGTCAIGEISSLNLTKDIMIRSGLGGVWFHEFLGNDLIYIPQNIILPENIHLSLAGHAPHTTSPNLLRHLKQSTNRKPFSIHLAESDDEIEFITSAKGLWADFLEERGVNFSEWGLPQISPVQHLHQAGILDATTLVVHLLHANDSDLEILLDHQCPVCLCPRSNKNLHNRLPDCERMIQKGLIVCLGTDSLASVDSLSLWDEMYFLWHQCPHLSPQMILKMATINGAQALGIRHQSGQLATGYKACFIFAPVEGNSIDQIAQKLVALDFSLDDMIIFSA